ncbi:MAG TPA: DinB family protein [Puia sp.]|nr:DinB family protein [Puia sp.]
MKRLLLFTLLTLTFTSSSVFAQFTQSQMVNEWERAKAYTKEYLDAMPEDGYAFKPTPEIRSFAQQMLHLADLNYAFASIASGKPSPFGHTSADHNKLERTAGQTKKATTKTVMNSYDFIITILQNMTADQLQEAMNPKKPDVTRFGMFGKAFEHQTHHRGQATIYLRLKGITPPGEKLF